MKTILVVEDFIPVQNFLRETLESCGYYTLGTTDGTRAYEILAAQPYKVNLIITDFHMPSGSGYELLLHMKENQALAKLPVIFLTAESNPEVISDIESMGCAAWIKKPYRADVLIREVKRALGCPQLESRQSV